MTEQGEGTPGSEDRLAATAMQLQSALTADFDRSAILGAFADVEMEITRAAEAGTKEPVAAFEALGEYSAAVSRAAAASEDTQLADMFRSRADTCETTVRLLRATTAIAAEAVAQAATAEARAEAAETPAPRRGRRGRTDTKDQKMTGAKK